MTFNLSPHVRFAIYLVTVIGTPLVAYLQSKGVLDAEAVQLWSAEVAVAGSIAAVNVATNALTGRHAADAQPGDEQDVA